MTRVRVDLRSYIQDRRKNDAFAQSVTLPAIIDHPMTIDHPHSVRIQNLQLLVSYC